MLTSNKRIIKILLIQIIKLEHNENIAQKKINL